MNNSSRKAIEEIVGKLESICSVFKKVEDELDNLAYDEEMSYDGLPENLQFTEKADVMLDSQTELENAEGHVKEANVTIKKAIDCLNLIDGIKKEEK